MKKKTMLILLTTVVSIILLAVSGYFIYNKVMSVSNFSDYLSKYQKEMSNCILNEEKKSEYDLIVKEAEDIINTKKSKEINKIKKKLINFKEMILKDNESLIEKYKSTIESYNLDRLSENSKESVGEQIEKIELIQSKNNYIELEQKYIALIDFIENALIEDPYKNLDGYWISDLDGYYMNLRIDLKNNTFTTIETLSEGYRLDIKDYKYNKENEEYMLTNILPFDGPQGFAGTTLDVSIKYIDENHIEINNTKLYKVTYEQAVYHYIYNRVIDRFETVIIDIDFFNSFNLYSQYTEGSVWNESMTEEEATNIIMNRIYSKEIIEKEKKLARTFEMNDKNIPIYNIEKFEIGPGIEVYYYNAKIFRTPNVPEYRENNDIILGNAYAETRCFSEGFILPNGTVLQTVRYDDRAGNIDDFKNVILSYYK